MENEQTALPSNSPRAAQRVVNSSRNHPVSTSVLSSNELSKEGNRRSSSPIPLANPIPPQPIPSRQSKAATTPTPNNASVSAYKSIPIVESDFSSGSEDEDDCFEPNMSTHTSNNSNSNSTNSSKIRFLTADVREELISTRGYPPEQIELALRDFTKDEVISLDADICSAMIESNLLTLSYRSNSVDSTNPNSNSNTTSNHNSSNPHSPKSHYQNTMQTELLSQAQQSRRNNRVNLTLPDRPIHVILAHNYGTVTLPPLASLEGIL